MFVPRYPSSLAELTLCVLLVGVLTAVAAEPVQQPPLQVPMLGIVTERPVEGRFVETDHGYMVPYTATIPGTDVQFTMVPIPGGKHEVTRDDVTYFVKIEPFWMAKTEVTWAEYKEYMKLVRIFDRFDDLKIRQGTGDDLVDAVTAPSILYDPSFVYEVGEEQNQPAITMRQYAAKQYTKWLSLLTEQFYRLPSEAEWVYACRADAKSAYSFGDDVTQLERYAWYFDSTDDYVTGKVATKQPNRWGLHDMHGNVAEWVLDGTVSDAKLPAGGSTVDVEEAIVWPTEEYGRIVKGGSFDSEAEECLSESRMISSNDWTNHDPATPQSPWWLSSDKGMMVGFRIMRPLTAPARAERERFWRADVPQIREAVDDKIKYSGRGERGLVDPGLPEAIKRLPIKKR
ncbi:MAG: formylglycine-generating enzyme family protein [Aeoliella sp.]